MRKRRHALMVLFLFFFAAVLQAPEAPAGQSADLPNYFELTPLMGIGGQPTDAGFRQLAEKGYKAVINLRMAGERVSRESEQVIDLAAEERSVSDLGMKYFGAPVSGRDLRAEQAANFLKITEGLQAEKVFVHCAVGGRAAAFVLLKRVLQDGIAQDAAEEEAAKAGLRSEPLLKFARDYISSRR
jgi:uncharacterized protein (TIGR01244 family)